ncbi:MAG: hypothetical protein EBZ49_00405 [Proteobacteria bacterium]|nr:hypothetical protein [Pseudomonadota bacterium]
MTKEAKQSFLGCLNSAEIDASGRLQVEKSAGVFGTSILGDTAKKTVAGVANLGKSLSNKSSGWANSSGVKRVVGNAGKTVGGFVQRNPGETLAGAGLLGAYQLGKRSGESKRR